MGPIKFEGHFYNCLIIQNNEQANINILLQVLLGPDDITAFNLLSSLPKN